MKHLHVQLDPNKRHVGWSANQLENMVGGIPYLLDRDNPATLKEQLTTGYAPHTCFWDCDYPEGDDVSTIDERGVMKFPGDPDMWPIAKMVRGDEVVYVYLYGMVGYVSPEYPNGTTCRMD